MSEPVSTCSIRIDVINPGHYFACCGLFEVASRISPQALAWFHQESTGLKWQFHLSNTPSLADIIKAVTAADLVCLDPSDNHSATKLMLPQNLILDWWRYERRSSGKLKTWAGKQGAFSILTALRELVNAGFSKDGATNLVYTEASPEFTVSYFDAPRSANSAARDVGFSIDKLKKGGVVYQTVIRPATEFFSFVGLQRCRPALVPTKPKEEQLFAYHTWQHPIPVTLVPVAVAGLMLGTDAMHYQFSNPSRTEDYLAFTPSKIISRR